MKQCSKSIYRRLTNPCFINHYFVGRGLDIGGKPDPLSLYTELFCQIESVKTWDIEDGDAQYLEGVKEGEFDFVHSSHCLEHLVDPLQGIKNWFRVVRPGGHLIVTVPDEDLYEQGVFPSTMNLDHKWTFTVYKQASWSDKSLNVVDVIKTLGEQANVQKIELLSASYRFSLPRYDQTLTPVGECGIEFVIRKLTDQEIETKGRWQRSNEQPDREVRLHLNQHKDDIGTLKNSNKNTPPFINDKDL